MNAKVLGKGGISQVIELLLRGLFIIGIGLTLSLPVTLPTMLQWLGWRGTTGAQYWRAFAFMVIFGLLMLTFVYFAARIFRTINEKAPFVEANLRSLSYMAWAALLLGLNCLWYIAFDLSVYAIMLGLVFVFLWALLLVLRELFRAAVDYKLENDFTI